MKIHFNLRSLVFSLLFLIVFTTVAQVGIGTTSPDSSSILDISDPTGSKGLLIPRVALTAINESTPIDPQPAVSLLVYNTATAGIDPHRVYPGYYYWSGTSWVALIASEKWDLLGNSGTNQSNNFIGTTDAQGLTFRTNNIERIRVANGNQLLAIQNGSSTLPFYSWNSDSDMGMFRIGTDNFGFSTNKIERLRLSASEAVFNDPGNNFNFRIESDNQPNMFFVSGTNNRIGINTNDPQTEFHLAGTAATVRIDELNSTNNSNNVSADPAPVYVNNEGDLTLQPPLIQTFMPVNNLNFLGNGVAISSNSGSGVTRSLLNSTINLTQESLVHVNYQFSVQITMPDGTTPVVDGASRLYRSYVTVNGSSNQIAIATGTYTNNPTSSGGGTYASGYYYLSGSGYIQLPAGSHSINLSVLGFGGNFGYRMVFGETDIENFQVVVHR
ncbi:hypothetical protein O4H26_00130 [Aequorivita viscosa]|nr:hypothetical protein [Aequorivita viscosa]